MIGDTGTALAAAILANPNDDAPWLVYADWLQEAGRDAEAMAIRSHLPALRDAIWNGHDLSFVLTLATSHPPGDPVWNAAFGLPLNLPDPEPVPAAPTPQPVWEFRSDTPRDEPAWGHVVALIVLAAVGVTRVLLPSTRDNRMQPVDKSAPDREFQTVAAARNPPSTVPVVELPTSPRTGPPKWEWSELSGSSLHRADETAGTLPFTFRSDGTVVHGDRLGQSAQWWKVNWSIDSYGELHVTGPVGTRPTRFVLLRREGDTYEVERNGTKEVYIRQRP